MTNTEFGIDVWQQAPCPFCGERHITIVTDADTYNTPDGIREIWSAVVMCAECNAIGPQAVNDNCDQSVQSAIRLWNRRTRIKVWPSPVSAGMREHPRQIMGAFTDSPEKSR